MDVNSWSLVRTITTVYKAGKYRLVLSCLIDGHVRTSVLVRVFLSKGVLGTADGHPAFKATISYQSGEAVLSYIFVAPGVLTQKGHQPGLERRGLNIFSRQVLET